MEMGGEKILWFILTLSKIIFSYDWDHLSMVSELGTMSTNKERVKNVGATFGDLQTKFDRMKVGVNDKLR